MTTDTGVRCPCLNSENYYTWSKRLRALCMKQVWQAISGFGEDEDGNAVEPSTRKLWRRKMGLIIKHINLKYLQKTKDYALNFHRTRKQVEAWVDADWASDFSTAKSVTGYSLSLIHI